MTSKSSDKAISPSACSDSHALSITGIPDVFPKFETLKLALSDFYNLIGFWQ
ncbi:MAG: hypothetical protein CM15mP13_2610 [Pseudomonadota bacterium]|nr:MAG: hypothetical protein CM15mP13_2610 [Pseudomonadota bacterium]